MLNNFRIVLFALLAILTLSNAQGQKPARIELPVPAASGGYMTLPIGEKGVLLISKPEKNGYRIRKFNTQLEEVYSIDGVIENGLDFVTATFDGRSAFLLFSRYRSSLYQIVKVNVDPGFVETFTINTTSRFEITDFKSLGVSIYMAGTVRDEPVLIHTNLLNLQTKILPSMIKGSNAIQSIEVDTTNRLVTVSFAVKQSRQTRLVARTYDETGELYSQVIIEPEDEYSMLSGRLQVLNETESLMIGTYGYRNMQSSSASASQGLYISKIVNNEVAFTKYYSFTDFENFFNFMGDRQMEKMERKIKKKKDAGDDVKLNYRLLVHNIIVTPDQYLLVAEVFYPEYKSASNMYGINSYFGNPWMYGMPFGMGLYNPWMWNPLYGGRGGYSNQVFDGFVYTHAVIAGMSKDGNLLWDNSISFDKMKSMELTRKVNVQPLPDKQVRLVYGNGEELKSKVVKGHEVTDADINIPLNTSLEGDKVRRSSIDAVSYWFGNYYLAWGQQRIVNPQAGTTESRGRRDVFYLNKIPF